MKNRQLEVALMRAANQKAGMKLKPEWYQENYKKHWKKVIENTDNIKQRKLDKFEEENYDDIQEAYAERLLDMWYSSCLIWETTDGYENFLLDYYNNA